MSDLHIYAFGHALVDEEYSISEALLQSLGIAKNHRTLIDYQRSSTLRQRASTEGNLNTRTGGGSGANTLATAALLGANCHFSCLLGNDSEGHFYQQQLLDSGISTDQNSFQESGHTGVCLVLLTPDAARTMNTYVGITDYIGPKHLNLPALQQAQWVYIEGHLLIAESGFLAALKARDEARRLGKKIAVNFCDPAVVRLCRERLAILLDEPVDLLFCNEEEAAIWAQSDHPEDAESAMHRLANSWALTRGEHGARVFDGTVTHQVDALNVNAVSTLGAGDTFAGAFLYGLVSGLNYAQAGHLASLAAAELVQQSGPRLTKDQLQKVKNQFYG